MTAAERELEEQGTALLSQLPKEARPGILLPDAVRRRTRRECPIPPVVAVRPGGAAQPGDPEQILLEWEDCARILNAADLSNEERACYLLHAQHGWTDTDIARLYGMRRATVSLRRHTAEAKIQMALSLLPKEAS